MSTTNGATNSPQISSDTKLGSARSSSRILPSILNTLTGVVIIFQGMNLRTLVSMNAYYGLEVDYTVPNLCIAAGAIISLASICLLVSVIRKQPAK